MSFCGSSLASAVQHQAEHKRPGQSCVGIPHLKPQFISNKPSPKLSFHLNRQSRSMHTGNTLIWQQRIFQLHIRKRTAEWVIFKILIFWNKCCRQPHSRPQKVCNVASHNHVPDVTFQLCKIDKMLSMMERQWVLFITYA